MANHSFFRSLLSPKNPGEASRRACTNPRRAQRRRLGLESLETRTMLTISVGDASAAEGTDAVFDVILSDAAAVAVTVNFDTADGTATAAGLDYTATSGTLTFAPGETSMQITVATLQDTLDEADENFTVVLSAPSGDTIADGTGMGTIVDDDPTPTLSIDDQTVLEGNAGTVNAIFTVSLSAASGQEVTVNFVTSNVTATAGADYVSASGPLTFAAGQTVQTITIQVNGDALDEVNETFEVNLSAPVNATILDGEGVGTITDDDPTPTLSIADQSVIESDAGLANAVFTVTLSAASGQEVVVDFVTVAGTATEGTDYVSISGPLTFAPGQTTQTVTVQVVGDTVDEDDETFVVNLSSPVNATIADASATGTIVDDDPRLSIDSPSIAEGDGATVDLVFTVSLTTAATNPVTVDFTTTGGTATSGTDFVATSGSLSFAVGETTKLVTVQVNGDLLDELNETFTVTLSNPSNATFANTDGTGTIVDDDPTPTLSINDQSVTEGDGGSVNAVFTVTLSAVSGQPVVVNFATADGTATAGTDYVSAGGPLTFAPGETTKLVTVQINGDLLDEANESFSVNLATPTGATIADGQGAGVIADNDPQPAVSINDASIAEGNAGTTNLVFTVTLSAASGQAATVNFATSGGTATSGTDFAATSGTLTFAAGETAKQVTVQVTGDVLDESNETFNVTLSGAVNASISDATGLGTIVDDDQPPSLSINDVSIVEGNGGTVNAVFTVTLTGGNGQAVTVQFNTAAGTGVAGLDFNATSGTLSFSPGQSTQLVTVQVRGDTLEESDETFFVNLVNAVNASISDNQGRGVIRDEDVPFLVVGADAGGGANIKVYDGTTGAERLNFLAFDAKWLGGVRVATGDVNGDGVRDIIAGAGPGGGAHVRVFDGNSGQQLTGAVGSFFAYDASYTGGVSVAAADLNGDGRAEIIVGGGPGLGGRAQIRVFDGATGAALADFSSYTVPGYDSEIHVAVGDVNGDGTPDIVTGAGAAVGNAPHVRVFSGLTAQQISGPAGSFFAYSTEFFGGVYVAVGDLDNDGRAEIITGAGAGGGPHVRAFNSQGTVLVDFFAYDPIWRGGVRVAVADFNNDGQFDLITGAGPGGGSHVKVYDMGTGQVASSFFAFPGFAGGVFVGGSSVGSGIVAPGSATQSQSALLGPSTPPSDEADAEASAMSALEDDEDELDSVLDDLDADEESSVDSVDEVFAMDDGVDDLGL